MSYNYFKCHNIAFDNDFLNINQDYYLIQLYKFRNTETNIAQFKYIDIADILDCSKRTIRNYDQRLEQEGIINKVSNYGKPDKYKLLYSPEKNFTFLPNNGFIEWMDLDFYSKMMYYHLCRLGGKNGSVNIGYRKLIDRIKCSDKHKNKLKKLINLNLVDKVENGIYFNSYKVNNLAFDRGVDKFLETLYH